MAASTPAAPAAPAVLADPDGGLAGQPVARRSSAHSDAALYTISSYVAQMIMFLANLVQRALLGPLGAGYWALMQTFWTYFGIATLGAQQGATRQIPAHRGRSDYVAAARVSNTGASFAVVMVGVAGAALALVAILFGEGWTPQIRFGLILLGITAPLRAFIDAQDGIIASVKRFDVASVAVVVQAVGALVLQCLAVWWLGFYGLFLGLVGIQLATIAVWVRMGVVTWRRPAFRWQIDKGRLRELIGFGAPILVYGQVWQLFLSIDSLIVAGAIDVRSLGYYALALSVTNYVLLLPKSVGATLFPRMAERFAQTGDMASIRHYATDTQRLLAYVLVPVSVAAAFCFVPVLIRQALPAFLPAVEVVHIVVAATFFLALQNMPVKLLITAGYRWSLTGIFLVCLAINATLTYSAVVTLDLGLRGAAGATAASYLIVFLLSSGFSLSRTLPLHRVALYLAEIVVVAAYAVAALWALEWRLGSSNALLADVGLGAVKLGLFLLVMTPWFALAEKRVGGLSMLRELAGGALAKVRKRGA